MDSSFVLLYYNPATEAATAWYPIPGIGPGASFETRFFVFQSSTAPSGYTFGVRRHNVDTGANHNTSVTFRPAADLRRTGHRHRVRAGGRFARGPERLHCHCALLGLDR
jgi:hypothetical protein